MYNRILLFLLFLISFAVAQEQNLAKVPEREMVLPEAAEFLADLKPHPRLMLTNARLGELKEMHQTEDPLKKCVAETVEKANQLIDAPVLERELVGIRLLGISRECLDRIYTLGVAWRWTGDDKYAKAAVKNLLAVCRFKDWNYEHFLDVAEMTHAVSIGYDWLYGYSDEQLRGEIRQSIVEKGLEPGLKIHLGTLKTKHNWPKWKNNWNQVCNYSMIIGSLAVADTNPEYAEKLVPLAVRSLPLAMIQYSPDGAWPEGPGYWEYATSYTVYGLCAMDTAIGTDFGLSRSPGLAVTAYYPIYVAGPTGKYFNFADSRAEGLNEMPSYSCSMWLGKKFNLPYVIADQHRRLNHRQGRPLAPFATNVVFYQPVKDICKMEMLPLDKLFDGSVQTSFFRSSWTDPDAIFMAIKAGDNQFPHAHLDLGSFVLDALSVRWVCDLGADFYDLPGYWEMERNGRRWTYYRLGSGSHNVLTFDDTNQNVYAKAKITDFESTEEAGSTVLDLSDAYKEFATQVVRKVSLQEKRRKVLIEDMIEVRSDCTVTWGMTTQAQVNIVSDRVAELTKDGRKMIVELLSPLNASFYVRYPHVESPQYDLEGDVRLEAKTPVKPGAEKFLVLFSPVYSENNIF